MAKARPLLQPLVLLLRPSSQRATCQAGLHVLLDVVDTGRPPHRPVLAGRRSRDSAHTLPAPRARRPRCASTPPPESTSNHGRGNAPHDWRFESPKRDALAAIDGSDARYDLLTGDPQPNYFDASPYLNISEAEYILVSFASRGD